MPKKPDEQSGEQSGEQPSKQTAGRADHLKPYQFKPGESGNRSGRPKGTINLHDRMVKELLRRAPEGLERADKIVKKIVDLMESDPAKMEKFFHNVMNRDEGPVDKGPLISIDARGRVPEAPPLISGVSGAPSLGEHLKRLAAIAKERGLADPMEQPQDVEAEITTTDD